VLPIILFVVLAFLVVLLFRLGPSTFVTTGAPATPGSSQDADGVATNEPQTDTMPSEINPRQNPEDEPEGKPETLPNATPYVSDPVTPGVSPNVGTLLTITPATDTTPFEINPRQNPNERPNSSGND
jgi:Rieske Fe-S protein